MPMSSLADSSGRVRHARCTRSSPLRSAARACALLVVAAVACGCSATDRERPVGDAERTHAPLAATDRITVGLVVADGVLTTEIAALADVFAHTAAHARPGMSVLTLAATDAAVETAGGLHLAPDASFESAPAIDILVVPSFERDPASERVLAFVRERATAARYVVALGGGTWTLALAGVIDDDACTTSAERIDALRARFPELDVQTEVSFAQSSRVITSQGGVHAHDPALYLTEIVYGGDVARAIASGLGIDWDLGRVAYVGTVDDVIPKREPPAREAPRR